MANARQDSLRSNFLEYTKPIYMKKMVITINSLITQFFDYE
jgi:hypothetical protein